jgi:predicted transglutaminase-like cysteine proteinase
VPAAAQQVAMINPAIRAPEFMRIYGSAQAPYGFVRFCETNPKECVATTADDSRFEATPERLSQLDELNRMVNHEIEPATDQEIYGVAEYWTLPKTRGDCEDYALLKRHILIARGWPSSALLMTVVRDEKKRGARRAHRANHSRRFYPRQQNRRRSSLEPDAVSFRHAAVILKPKGLGISRS